MQPPPMKLFQKTSVELLSATQEIQPTTETQLVGGVQVRFKVSKDKFIYIRKFSQGRGIVEVDAGLGKSRIAIETAKKINPNMRILVLCKKNSINTWRREVNKWWAEKSNSFIVIHGQQPHLRPSMWGEAKDVQITITTYDTARNDSNMVPQYDMVICDEAQKIRNYKIGLTKECGAIIKKCRYMLFLSASIVRKGPQELYSYMNMLFPKLHTSYWRWVNTFCQVDDSMFGKQIVGPRNTEALGEILATCMIRIKEKDVEDQRPPFTRSLHPYEMTKEQRGIYNSLRDDLLAVTDGGEIITIQNAATKTIRLRQLLVCPKILDPSLGYGAGLEEIGGLLEDDPHTVIITPFTAAIPHIQRHIMDLGWGNPFVLRGGCSPDEIKRVEEEFNESKSAQERACVLSTSFAESFELWSAKRCFHLGFEWMQDRNYQAEKRLHRLTTPHAVNSYYMSAMDSIDQEVLVQLEENSWNTNLTFKHFTNYVIESLKEAR